MEVNLVFRDLFAGFGSIGEKNSVVFRSINVEAPEADNFAVIDSRRNMIMIL